jgi:hypothetical protein
MSKRGRKSTKTPEVVTDTLAGLMGVLTEDEPVKNPRNGKKTPQVVAIVAPSGISGTFMAEQRPLIAHLPISSTEVNFEQSNLILAEKDAPSAYNTTAMDISYISNEPVNDLSGTSTNGSLQTHYSEKLMVAYQDSNRNKCLPDKTEIVCFWDCHPFSTPPVCIPSHIVDDEWRVYGNFCSPECAVAYLFKERIDSHVQWERYALLNSLYVDDAKIPVESPSGIRPAPPKEILRMFGGSMDIAEYRKILHEKVLRIDVLTPPMVSIIQTMDTKPIDFYDQNLKNVFIRNDIQHKYNAPGAQGLRLRRNKPVKSRESTIDWAMQIHI